MTGFVTGALFAVGTLVVAGGLMAAVALANEDNSIEAWTALFTIAVVGGALGSLVGLHI